MLGVVACSSPPAETVTSTEQSRTEAHVEPNEAHVETAEPSLPTSAPVVPPTTTRLVYDDEGLFDPAEDDEVIEVMQEAEIVRVERGHGGRSLAFRVTFADGSRAYFKPEQTFSGTHWQAEIAAYHLDRMLGLRRVAPVVGRRVPWALLGPAAEGDPRIHEIVVREDGFVRGAMVAWIEERLVPLDTPEDWWTDVRIEPAPPSPFEAVRDLRSRPSAGEAPSSDAHDEAAAELPSDAHDEAPTELPSDMTAVEPEATSDVTRTVDAAELADAGTTRWDREGRPAELSDLVVFDYLIHNSDRWGGGNTNVRTRDVGGPLIYLDNAAGFARRRPRLPILEERLHFVQRFRARTLRAIERLDVADFVARVETDPLSPILDAHQIASFEERRAALLEYVAAEAERLGRDAVVPW